MFIASGTFCCCATLTGTQGLFLVQHSGISPGWLWGPHLVLVFEPGSVHALPTVLSLKTLPSKPMIMKSSCHIFRAVCSFPSSYFIQCHTTALVTWSDSWNTFFINIFILQGLRLVTFSEKFFWEFFFKF